jgi:hypothetical protein
LEGRYNGEIYDLNAGDILSAIDYGNGKVG